MKWIESISIDAPADEVFDRMLDQDDVMGWSAWPEATGFTCAVDGDGESPGSEIVFTDDDGRVQGRQTIVSVDRRARVVHNRMENRGPFGRTFTPRVDFKVEQLGERRSRAMIDFENHVPLPTPLRQVVDAVMGRWVRRLHVKDLEQLKAQAEAASAGGS